ncbi:MAG: RodZ domain-containing protein [Ramlibacter sp.]
MSETWSEGGTPAFTGQPIADDALTAGDLLRRARQVAGLHVAALAVSLKVPVRKLEALEENRWDLLPDAVFVRALASSVCRTLKIDVQPVLDRLPQTAAPRLVQDTDGINTPFRAPGDGAPPTWFDQLTKPVFLAVFALLLGALVLILLPATQREESMIATATTESRSVFASAPGAAVREPVSTTVVPVPALVAASGLALPVPAATATATHPEPAKVAAAVVEGNLAPVGAVGTGTTTGVVVFKTRGPSWVEVSDAKGVVVIRKLLVASETAGASGALPLQVTIGRADATEVQVRGKAFDLKPVSRDNVARFEVR